MIKRSTASRISSASIGGGALKSMNVSGRMTNFGTGPFAGSGLGCCKQAGSDVTIWHPLHMDTKPCRQGSISWTCSDHSLAAHVWVIARI